ncbi:hypothetical protein [Cellulomonas sp.]|uniref:hypothetical protein n=1 Tax=Cellulomonas sp. TaxID=40001 RepID=UPI003BAB377F
MGNREFQETRLIERVLDRLRLLVPDRWRVAFAPATEPGSLDGVLSLTPPTGEPTSFAVELKLGYPTSAKAVVQQALMRNRSGMPAIVATDFASPVLRKTCQNAGMGYVDETGWISLTNDSGILIRSEGAARAPGSDDPRRVEITRLDGPGASRVIRTLWLLDGPTGVRSFAANAGTSPGTVTKVLRALERHGAVERDGDGQIVRVDRGELLDRWIQDYNFYSSNAAVDWYLAPRGPDRILHRLEHVSVPLSLTGYHAARMYMPDDVTLVVPATQLVAYTPDADTVAAEMNLRPASKGVANVVLASPRDRLLVESGHFPTPMPQVIADLMTMGGRYPELGEQLFEATTGNPWQH